MQPIDYTRELLIRQPRLTLDKALTLRWLVYIEPGFLNFSLKGDEGVYRDIVCIQTNQLALRDVRFIIDPVGQSQAREDGLRSVHAYARGYLTTERRSLENLHKVTYKPHLHDKFMRGDAAGIKQPQHWEPIENLSYLYMSREEGTWGMSTAPS